MSGIEKSVTDVHNFVKRFHQICRRESQIRNGVSPVGQSLFTELYCVLMDRGKEVKLIWIGNGNVSRCCLGFKKVCGMVQDHGKSGLGYGSGPCPFLDAS